MGNEDLFALSIFIFGLLAFVFYALRKKTKNTKFIDLDEATPPIPSTDNLEEITGSNKFFSITSLLIAGSVGLALISNLGSSTSSLALFFIASPDSTDLQNIFKGELWRLITPIFIHFGPLHLLFNMMWLWDLGNLIEKKKGHLFICKFVLAVGISSNLAQYLFTQNQFFGGMSGVVYGLLGYVWMQGKHHPGSGMELNKQTVIMMIVWFILCWTGILGPIANWAHTFGLGVGLVIGFFDTNAQKSNT